MNFISIDFETAKYSRESAISVGLVKFIDGKPTDTFYSLIRPPELYIRPDFTDIHGLTVEDVKDAPTFADLWDSAIKPFITAPEGRREEIHGLKRHGLKINGLKINGLKIRNLPLAAHNASFDMSVLWAVLEWYELEIPALQYFCTQSLSRRTWPGLESYALTALAEKFGIEYNAHNALDDALTCGKLVQMSAAQFGSADIAELLKAAGVEMNSLML